MQKVTPEGLSAMNAQVERATCEIADVRPDVVANACLVAIMSQGPRAHHDNERQIASYLEREGASAPVVSSAGALLTALAALQARRIAIITPYAKPLTRSVADYIEDSGVEVRDALSLEVTDNRAVAALDPSDLNRHWRRLDLTGCDAIVASACVQMPSLPVIEVIERESGLPTLSAATATAFVVLRTLGVDTEVQGAGSLLHKGLLTERLEESDIPAEKGVTYESHA